MSGTPESGHAKNVANFEDLISFCTSYGDTYNPTKESLKLSALTGLLATVNTSLQAHKVAKTNFDNATNARKLAFHPLKQLTTRVVNALSATDTIRQTVDDAKSINKKIRGKRSKAVIQPVIVEGGPAPAPVRTISVSQQSFDKLIDHFSQLIQTVSAEPLYMPNEANLTVAALKALLLDLKAKNTGVMHTYIATSNARIARDRAMYAHDTGMVDTSVSVKTYVKSVFGSSSPEYKQLSALRFTYRSGV